jgi:hypothetical protein
MVIVDRPVWSDLKRMICLRHACDDTRSGAQRVATCSPQRQKLLDETSDDIRHLAFLRGLPAEHGQSAGTVWQISGS